MISEEQKETKKKSIIQAFNLQTNACENLGSPFTGRLCRLIASNLDWDSEIGRYLLRWQGRPDYNGDNIPLRMAGALHALVLLDMDDVLQTCYPPNHANVTDCNLWSALEAAFENHLMFIKERLSLPPQTNEIRRSAVLLAGFSQIASKFAQPLVLSELGSSGGLNLIWDRYRYELAGTKWGEQNSPICLCPEWIGDPLKAVDMTVAQRSGCDLNPPNLTSELDRMLALSFIWPDQGDRLDRTKKAMEMLALQPIAIDRQDAITWLKGRLSSSYLNKTHVVFHTIVRQYFSSDEKQKSRRLIEEAGASATPQAPLAWLSVEADQKAEGAGIVLDCWPDGSTVELGRADFHGRWIKWYGS